MRVRSWLIFIEEGIILEDSISLMMMQSRMSVKNFEREQ